MKTVFKVAGHAELHSALSTTSLPKIYINRIVNTMWISLDGHLNIADDIVIHWCLSDNNEFMTVEVEVGGLY